MPESNHIIKKNAPDRTDILIVGAGPAGIFCALGLLGRGDGRHITIVEKGLPIEHRSCPKAKTGVCVHCNPCRITTGFSGAGAFSDGKLSLSHEVGGDLPDLIGADLAQKTIGRVDQMYLDFGADVHVRASAIPTRSPRSAVVPSKRASNSWIARSAIWARKRPRSCMPVSSSIWKMWVSTSSFPASARSC